MITPLIPANLTWLALAIGGGLFAAGAYVPPPYNLVCAGLGSVALYLAGKGWRVPQWAVGKPLLPAALTPLALAGIQLLTTFGGALPAAVQPYVAPLVGLLSLLAGVVEPEPLKATGTVTTVPNNDGTVTAAVDPKCSIADRARGLC
ncbi:hypothetical protein Mx8p70 [Myxococcus phage Mx8]|uniref:p70 n=1 Tax=Myxococcus phage Mx8 TaxID=49964 RepID=Q94MP9_9CAUD|nr:hypothetical protein Mx8p70 [Myxococcus phage Mx8]AAK94405.1 p70 [Myxococcus phage Mx8]